jgi:C1A family cysteine protease
MRRRTALAGVVFLGGGLVLASVASGDPIRVAAPPTRHDVQAVASAAGDPPSVDVARPATRRAASVMRPPKKNASGFNASSSMQAQARMAKFAAAESAAQPATKAKVQATRDLIAQQHLHFSAAVTAVSHKDLNQITGVKVKPPDAHKLAAAKAKRAQEPVKANLVRSQLLQRAAPPKHFAAKDMARMNSRDVAAAGPTSDNTNQNGKAGASYPSSQFPSPTSAAFSWRDRMTVVKNQESCGSCWAFATTGVLEATEILFNGGAQSLDLAEQQLVNCTPPFQAGGDNCDGNDPAAVWKYLGGTPDAMESSVPYKAAMQQCDSSAGSDNPYKVKDWGYVDDNDVQHPSVDEIKAAIVAHGPVVATVRATTAFQNYGGGVFDESDPGETNHAIVLVGWDDSKQAWHLRNSWSPDWGEDGYMWIKYGANSVGAWASWVQPTTTTQPSAPTFSDRYLSIANDAGEALTVYVQGEVEDGAGGWKWAPAGPGASAAAFKYTLAPGQSLDVKRTDTNEFLTAKAARIWATSASGSGNWTEYQSKDLVMASAPYKAAARDRTTYHLQAGAKPTPSAAKLLAAGKAAITKKDWAAADDAFQQLVDHYPSDHKIVDARYWLGYAKFHEQKYKDAVDVLYKMVSSAPDGNAMVPFGVYYLGLSAAGEGECGYAVRNLEVVAYGEIDAPASWERAAKKEISTLENDDGTICSSWD